MRSRPALATLALLVLSGCVGASFPTPSTTAGAAPFRLAVFGDSFTAVGVPGVGDRGEISWATGTAPAVHSVLQRIQAEVPGAVGSNGAFSGARMQDVPRQAANVPPGADEVIVWLGINDLCWPDPTSPQTFRSTTAASFDLIRKAHPDARVIVFAIPDLWQLHELHLQTPRALAAWKGTTYCAGFFSPGTDPLVSVEARARRLELNAVLAQEAEARGFAFSEATEWPGLSMEHFATADYFHPNALGEAAIAAAAWPSAAPQTGLNVRPLLGLA